jgi:phosphoribosylanthranilate isomerase
MRNRFLLSLLVAALPIAASADEAAELKRQVQANHVKSMKGFAKKDIKAVMAGVSDKYSGIGMTGQKVNKAGFQAEMQEHMRDTKKVNSSSYTLSDVKVNGNKASAKAKFKLDAIVVDSTGMMGKKGQTHRLQMDMDYDATWAKSGSKWLLTSENPTGPPNVLIDGKAMGAPAPSPAAKASK